MSDTPALPEPRSTYTVDAVKTAVDLLLSVAKQPNTGVSELARQCRIGKARAYRLLRTLEETGLLQRTEEDQRFQLGYTALVVGTAAIEQIDVARAALGEMAKVGEILKETVQLRIKDGDEAVCIGKWEPNRDLRVHAAIGRRRPLGRGSNKVLLAYQPDEEIASILDRLTALGRFAPDEIPTVLKVMRTIRDQGYYVSHGEVSEHLVSIAAPIFGHDRKLLAAINVSAPGIRMDDAAIERGIRHLCAAASRLSAQLNAPTRHSAA